MSSMKYEIDMHLLQLFQLYNKKSRIECLMNGLKISINSLSKIIIKGYMDWLIITSDEWIFEKLLIYSITIWWSSIKNKLQTYSHWINCMLTDSYQIEYIIKPIFTGQFKLNHIGQPRRTLRVNNLRMTISFS